MSKNAKIANSMRQSKFNTLDANLIAFLVMKEHSRAHPNIFVPSDYQRFLPLKTRLGKQYNGINEIDPYPRFRRNVLFE